ncbi:hypothetical protein H6P1_00491 (plasmid) [Variovorax sp. PBL-H6]|nr:hypothetical protein SRS16P1_00415 [Variovorax sp. SRS16]VTU43044.1 hypothetical protein E5P1_00413 [Variovorax sp. PBL-E5]VTU43515.1 hypothetical protein H6P1_00491 [Variovorax sp. PBL-H6]
MPRAMPEGMFDPMPKVSAKLSTGEEVSLFQFYPDELTFTEAEFVGLTVEEARKLHQRKDVAYLRS